MKRYLILIFLIFSLYSCRIVKNDLVVSWINEHNKPIKCNIYDSVMCFDRVDKYLYKYLLIDADGNCYYNRHWCEIRFPDIIENKIINEEIDLDNNNIIIE